MTTLIANSTLETPELQEVTKTSKEQPYKVIVLNDPVNLMSYVTMVFRKVFGFSKAKADKHMMEVHKEGRSILWSGHKEKAEAYVYTLLQWQLHAILEKDGND